ncbi:hypothetical protein [Glaciimonas sp. PAMC28666]|uniref:hypothetical protein n=1 Tax=Glaciimonas sp. PAMC28666 TaxID=2807626 RepID=UPI001F0380A6|nr:hypothetical protein [Glaciimonas sp. PAMC28666]
MSFIFEDLCPIILRRCEAGFSCNVSVGTTSEFWQISYTVNLEEITMGSELILDMWSRTGRQIPRATFDDLVEMLATEIANISDKLSEDELYRMIAVGALIYHRGDKEVPGLSTEDLLIKTLYEGGRA